MRVRLKGLNSVRKKLSDGRVATYWYAWKGGPALKGAPGTPEFIASYNAAVASRVAPRAETLQTILRQFQDSAEWKKLAPRTQSDYKKKVILIEAAFGDFPLAALGDRRARADFLAWRDKLAEKSPRQADLSWTVLARVFSWAAHRGLIDNNPCKAAGRLYEGGARKDKIWTPEQETAFLAVARGSVRLAFLLAINTGQRQGDLLRLPWTAYDGQDIRLKQSKTGVRVRIPVTAALKAALDAMPRKGQIVLLARGDKPYTEGGFQSSWGKVCDKAKIEGVTFHDLRGTAVTRLFVAGCTDAEVATITGHSLNEVRSILDANYFSRDYALAQSGIAKLEGRAQTPNQAPNQQDQSNSSDEKS